jgi:tetratricopeptide (TPR) repeat protein
VDPEDPRIPVEAGLVYEDRREYSRALDSYLKAVDIDSSSLQAHYRAGILLRTLKTYRKAGEMLKRAAELAPTNQDVMHQLAAVRALELVHG